MTREVFADTGYWIALFSARDEHHSRAEQASKKLGSLVRIVTSDMVLSEFLNAFAVRGEYLRAMAGHAAEQMASNPNVHVVPQTRSLYRRALDRYRQAVDKGWSLTDCASFEIMRERGIAEALAHDKHFAQAGFTALLRDAQSDDG